MTFAGLTMGKLVLVWMLLLVPSAPWRSTFERTSEAVAGTCDGIACAAVMTALGMFESRFNPEAVGASGERGVWQIGRHWNPPEDVEGQAALAHALIRESFRVCARAPLEERLGWYASGGSVCGRAGTSRIRMRLATALLGEGPKL